MTFATKKNSPVSETLLTISLLSLTCFMLLAVAVDAISLEQPKNATSTNLSEANLPWVKVSNREKIHPAAAIETSSNISTKRQLFRWPSSQETQFVGTGNVFVDDENRLQLAGGNLQAVDVEANLLGTCRLSNELSIEISLIPTDENGTDYKSILTFRSKTDHHNFLLGQEGTSFVFQLKTTLDKKPLKIYFGTVTPGEQHHLLISYHAGILICFQNGRPVLKTSAIKGNLENWQTGHVMLGGESSTEGNWQGSLEMLSIHGRRIDRNEAFNRYDIAMVR